MNTFIFNFLVLLAAVSPFLYQGRSTARAEVFPGWPQQLNGNALMELPLSERERYFAADFPGKIGRFTDGEREIVMRWVSTASRKLHPASDCYRGAGYSVTSLPIYREQDGSQWGCFKAERQAHGTRVCERIYDDSGNSWSDTSSWFWDALRGNSNGPWWAVTVTGT